MRDFGRFQPFNWHTNSDDINPNALYRLPGFSFIINKAVTSVTRVRVSDGNTLACTLGARTWDINGTTLNGTFVSVPITEKVRYYLVMVVNGVTYYTDIIEGVATSCVTTLGTTNSCNNTNYPFADYPTIFSVHLPFVQHDVPKTEDEYETIITEFGEDRRLIGQRTRFTMWFIQPKWYENFLAGLRSNDEIYISSDLIKNIEVEMNPIGDGVMAEFRITYEYVSMQQGNDCCDDINLTDILSPDSESGGPCDDFVIAITNTDDTLTVTLTDEPTGTPSYRWYRNGVLISTAASINILQPGDYRVDVTIAGCRATASYFKDDFCGLFDVDVYSSGNFVNADLSNVPEDCTPEYSVILNGTEVATTVPYEVSETGTYFVKVTACNCVKSGGVYIAYSDDTNCEFTADIDVTGSTLSADTDAISPTYLWEFEDGTGRTTVGTGNEITALNKGIYWLNVTSGGCSKDTYVYLAPSSQTGVVVLYRCNGFQFDAIGLNLLNFSNPANDLLVTINGTVHSYTTDTSPDSANLYSINTSNQLVTRSSSPFTNATIIIKVL